jgi:phosphoglycerate kinase
VAYKTLDDLDVAQKRVLVRVDINVPVRDGAVSDDTRIRAIVPTVLDILAQGGRPILLAHFGRPKGRVVAEMSLAVTLPALKAALGVPVRFTGDCIGPEAEAARGWAISMSTTPSRRRTGPMPRPRGWRGVFPPPPGG